MRNLILLTTVLLTIAVSMYVGMLRSNIGDLMNIPNIGSVQVLNGCGVDGAAARVANFLRENHFDVKSTGDAPSWNYPATMVISRTADMSLAKEVDKVLGTGRVVIIRNNEQLYDVTVVAGPDFEERIK